MNSFKMTALVRVECGELHKNVIIGPVGKGEGGEATFENMGVVEAIY